LCTRRMHRIIEQTTISCGMVKTPNPKPATKETAVYAEYRYRSTRTQGSHPKDEARATTE
jgi:hypothetical protein